MRHRPVRMTCILALHSSARKVCLAHRAGIADSRRGGSEAHTPHALACPLKRGFWHSLRWIPVHKVSLLLASWRGATSASISGAHNCEVELQKLASQICEMEYSTALASSTSSVPSSHSRIKLMSSPNSIAHGDAHDVNGPALDGPSGFAQESPPEPVHGLCLHA